MVWLYIILAPLLFMLAASRMNGARKMLIATILFIGGYAYIMIRKATQHSGERVKKRQFLNRVAPRGTASMNGNSGGSPYKSGSYTPSPSPMSRQSSESSQYSGYNSPVGKQPPMIRQPSAPLEFSKAPGKDAIKMSRSYSSQATAY